MFNKKFWQEMLYKHFGQYFIVSNILHKEVTGKHELLIFNNPKLGVVMALDNIVQTTEYDEFIYHEIITHIPLIAHGHAKKVLIIGGGDGGVLREVSHYHCVEHITMVEVDYSVIDLCKRYLPHHNAGSFNDSRFNLIINDGAEFLSRNNETFDIIISDCTDPIGPGKNLFTDKFYQDCARCLNQDGIFVSQNGVCLLQKEQVINSYLGLTQYFEDVKFYQATVPTYYGGVMTFSWASQNPRLRQIKESVIKKRMKKNELCCRYYNAALHNSSFTLPQYLLDTFAKLGSRKDAGIGRIR